MSLSDPTINDPHNSGARRSTGFGDLSVPSAPTASPLGQIRGVARKGSTGAGIPKHVTNVASSVGPASSGTTGAVSVTYSRDPADAAHEKVNVYVRGYQGNSSAVQVASGSESPVTFVLNNTGETVSILVQAQGNSGAAPLATAPSTGVQLAKSTLGGYGTQTVTQPPPVTLPTFTSAYLIGPFSEFPSVSGGSQSVSATNTVSVIRFFIPFYITLTKCSINVTGGSNGKRFSFGVYTESGSKVIDSGVFTVAGTGVLNKTFTAVKLSPGVYYFAQTCEDVAGVTVASYTVSSTTILPVVNAGTVVLYGTAANASVNGALPSALGTVTADVSSTTVAASMAVFT